VLPIALPADFSACLIFELITFKVIKLLIYKKRAPKWCPLNY
jgi:hypothetical protein